jgi:hypothetical protein
VQGRVSNPPLSFLHHADTDKEAGMLRRYLLFFSLFPAMLSAPLPAFADTSDMSTPDSSLVRMITANPGRKMTLSLYNGEKLTGRVTVVADGIVIENKNASSLTKAEKATRSFKWEQIQKIEIEEKRSGINRAVVIGSWIMCAVGVVFVAVLFLNGY